MAADFNGDGRADLAGVQGTDIDVADFNGDTIQDLVVAIATNGSRTAILIGNGDGTFRAPLIITEPNLNIPQYRRSPTTTATASRTWRSSLGDGNTGLMEILNGNGDGTFQPRVMYLPPPPIERRRRRDRGGELQRRRQADIALGRAGAFPGFLVLINSTGAAPPATPSAPTLLSPAKDATPAQPVTLDWTDVSAAASYRIQIDDSSTFSAPLVVDQTVTASQLTAPTLAARQHWWRVRGINSAGTAGAWSSVRRFTPQAAASAPAPATPRRSSARARERRRRHRLAGHRDLDRGGAAAGSGDAVEQQHQRATVPASVTVRAGRHQRDLHGQRRAQSQRRRR